MGANGHGGAGDFAMGVTLTLTPTLVLAKSVQNLLLPKLSAALDDTARFKHLSTATLQAILVLGLVFVVIVALIGGLVVHVLLGEKYADLQAYLEPACNHAGHSCVQSRSCDRGHGAGAYRQCHTVQYGAPHRIADLLVYRSNMG